MIIRYTFNDNDFTQIIEKYLEEFGPYGRWIDNDLADVIITLGRQYNDYNDKYNEEKKMNKGEYLNLKKRITLALYRHFIAYIDSIAENSNWSTPGFDAKHLNEDAQYIKDNINIKLVRNIPDQWENGEVVYCIDSTQHITM